MSGEAVQLSGDPFIVRALSALNELPRDMPDHVVIGGLAVMIRLEQTHRVTGDVDLASGDEPTSIKLLVGGDATRTRNGVRRLGVDIDIIDASDPGVTPQAANDEAEKHAIENQLAFANALHYATVVEISALSGVDTATATVRVATASDLVILKLHSTLDPRRAPMKRGSDLYDLARLLLQHGTGAIGNAMSAAPRELRASVVQRAREVLIDESDRSAARLRSSNVRGVEVVAADQLELIGRALIAAIERNG